MVWGSPLVSEAPSRRAIRSSSATWIVSGVSHVVIAAALRLIPIRTRAAERPIEAPPVEMDVTEAPPETAPTPPPPTPETAPAPTPAARAERSAARRALPARTASEPENTVEPVTPAPTPPVPPPTPAPTPAPMRAADLLRASSSLAVTGASEGWLAPAPLRRPDRNIFGGNATGEPPSPERLREIAGGPIRAALAETVRDHRPAGSGAHDTFVARRALESFDPVREIPGLGTAVRRAPVVTIPGVQRAVPRGEGGVAENFDQAHGASFAGMTLNTRMPDLRYPCLRADLDVDQDAAGTIRAVRVASTSGMRAFDAAAERAMREAMPEHPWTAGQPRSTRWRFEVSEAVGASLTNGNEGWTVLGHESDGTRVRVRVRMISQRLTGDAGA